MSKEKLPQRGYAIEIGTDTYSFTSETQQFLSPVYVSKYRKDTSVIVIQEPHESSEGHFNLFKGLESFFASNPGLAEQTIFLSEGTVANVLISVQELIDEDPQPTDRTIRQVLQSHLITGYMAYEWKHRQGIPIIGTEDETLYELSRRFASLCREDLNAVFQHTKHTDGTEFDIPLVKAWCFAVAARNKSIAQTLIEQAETYINPMLFVAWDHVNDQRSDFEKKWDKIINRCLEDAQYMGIMGALMFPWSSAGEDWWLYRDIGKNSETFDIHHYLEAARIGYTFLTPEGADNASSEDIENYNRVFRDQR